MAWTSMHFAVGMAGGAAIAAVGCAITRRGWRWVPGAMVAGGFWAILPDTPRLFREDFPWVPFMGWYANKTTEAWLHEIGNVFFFHQTLDRQPHNYSLHGLLLIILLFTLGWVWMLLLNRHERRRGSQAALGIAGRIKPRSEHDQRAG